jgi:hypothetical protein
MNASRKRDPEIKRVPRVVVSSRFIAKVKSASMLTARLKPEHVHCWAKAKSSGVMHVMLVCRRLYSII